MEIADIIILMQQLQNTWNMNLKIDKDKVNWNFGTPSQLKN
jgi:hypothetical protein